MVETTPPVSVEAPAEPPPLGSPAVLGAKTVVSVVSAFAFGARVDLTMRIVRKANGSKRRASSACQVPNRNGSRTGAAAAAWTNNRPNPAPASMNIAESLNGPAGSLFSRRAIIIYLPFAFLVSEHRTSKRTPHTGPPNYLATKPSSLTFADDKGKSSHLYPESPALPVRAGPPRSPRR